MTYFQNFDTILYDFTIKGDTTPIIEEVVNLNERVEMKISSSDLDRLCERYIVMDGETPEKISYKLYGTPLLHWTIMYVNGIQDLHANWPLTELTLVDFCKKKYGEANLYAKHHIEKMPEMLTMDETFIQEQIDLGNFPSDSILEVTNMEYEERKNELKRFIRVISPDRISGFVDLYKKAMVKNG